MRKRITKSLIIVSMFFTMLFATSSVASAGGVADILSSFSQLWPDGSYFSTTGGACGPGQTNGYCTYCQLAAMDWPAYEACGNGDSCWGFANYVFYNIFGYAPRNLSKTPCTNVNDVAVIGDYVICVNSSGQYYHYFIYMGSAGGQAYYAYESNIDVENKVRYNLKHCSEWGNLNAASYLVVHAPNYAEKEGLNKDTTNPVISNVTVTDKTDKSFTVKCYASDNVGITDVSFVVFPEGTQPNDSSWHGCTNLGNGWWTYTYTIPTEGTYCVRLYAWDAGGNWGEYVVPDQVFKSEVVVHTHTPEAEPDKPATCTEAGYKGAIKCSTCGETITARQTIPATGHNWGDWSVVKQATETEEGLEIRICGNDSSHTETRIISKKEHTHTPEAEPDKPATCTEAGYKGAIKCSTCGETITAGQTIPAKGHDWGEWTVVKAATETEDGVEVRICRNDSSHMETRTISKNAHTHTPEAEPDKPATCTEEGYTGAIKCSTCGETITARQTIPATGHNWGDWTVVKEATTTETGLEIRICKNDSSHMENKVIPVSGGNVPVDTRIDASLFNVRYYLSGAVYTGRPLTPIFILLDDKTLTEGVDYTITYSENILVGKGKATITGIGAYKGTKQVTFPITPAANSIRVTPLSTTIKYAKLKSKAQTVTIKATASGENAKTSCKLTSVPKKAKKYISMNGSGKITIKKGLAKGTYKLTVRVTSAATANYAAATVEKTIRIIVK